MTYWTLVLDNFEGEFDSCYFKDYETAKTSFDALVEKYSCYDEFECEDNNASWFDPQWNEYSTYVRLVKTSIIVRDKPITKW